jgi:O-methyltransferase/aklanonic acid methyltransferase
LLQAKKDDLCHRIGKARIPLWIGFVRLSSLSISPINDLLARKIAHQNKQLRTKKMKQKSAQQVDQKAEIVGVYDRAASTYDQVGIRTASYFGNLLIEKLNMPAGAQVLDVATGRGALLLPAAQKVGPAGRVIGIDLAPGMVAATAAEIRRRELQQAEVCWMDGDDPTFPEKTFDYILCGFALHFLDYPHALGHFRQLLKPGGTMATVGPYIPIEDRENAERWQWLFQLTREVFPPDFVPPSSWTAPNRLKTPEALTAALQDAGFVDIST